MERSKKSFRNSSIAAIGQIVILLATFVSRTVFIKVLNETFLGFNGLFSNILSILSFADLGIGTAITFSYYQPLVNDDREAVNAISTFLRRIYQIIALSILIIGIAVVPFLGKLTGVHDSKYHIGLYFVLYLLSSVLTYTVAYKRTLLIASENGYIDSLNQMWMKVIQAIIQVISLLFFRSYESYLIVQIITVVVSNLQISRKTDSLFSWVDFHSTKKIPQKILKELKQNVGGMIASRVGSIVVLNTDNILISMFVSIGSVGLYSNYTMLTNAALQVITQCTGAVSPNIGHDLINKDRESNFETFSQILSFVSVFVSFAAASFAVLVNPFVDIWIGHKYVFSTTVVVLIVLNFFLMAFRQVAISYVQATGLFWDLKWKQIIEAGLNLVFTLVLLYSGFGIEGVLMGTVLSTLMTSIWWEPYVVYKKIFKKDLISYLLKFVGSVFLAVFLTLLGVVCTKFIWKNTFSSFIMLSIIVVLLFGLISVGVIYLTNARVIFKKILRILSSRLSW